MYTLFDISYVIKSIEDRNLNINSRQLQAIRRAYFGTGNTNIAALREEMAMLGFEVGIVCDILTSRHKNVSTKLKHKMNKNGVTYKQLSEELIINKVSEGNIRRLLNEPNILNPKFIVALSKYLRLDGAHLIEEMGYMEVDKISMNSNDTTQHIDFNKWAEETEQAWQRGYDECKKTYEEEIIPDIQKAYVDELTKLIEANHYDTQKLNDKIASLEQELRNKPASRGGSDNEIRYLRGRILQLEKMLDINRCDYDSTYYKRQHNYNNNRPSQFTRDNNGVMKRR